MKYLMMSAFMLLLAGCSSFTSPARYHELDTNKSYWMDYDATRRGTIVSNRSNQWSFCAEPTPDAAINLVSKLNASVQVMDKMEVSGDDELNQSIASLAEKTQMVLFLRESLYRLCELSINSNLTPEQVKSLYKLVMDSSIKVIETERLQAQKEASAAETERLEADKRLKAADQAQYIYQYLSEHNVDADTIEGLLKDIP